MSINKLTLIGISLSICAILAGCEKKEQRAFQCEDLIGCIDIGPQELIKIASLNVMSGEVKSLGLDQVRMAKLAIANHNGKLLGHPIELQEFDEMCTKEGGLTAAQQIVSNPRIVAVFGTTCSGAAGTAMKIISKSGYAMISGANTAPSLTTVNGQEGPDHYAGYFRTSHNDEIQGRAAAIFTYRILKIKKAATIHDGDVYTKGLVQVFQEEFKRLGGEIAIATAVNKGDTNMQPVLKAVAESGAKLIFFPLFQPEGDYIVKQARKMPAFDSIALMGADGLLQKPFFQSVSEAGKGMYFVGPANPQGASYEQLVAQYLREFKEPPLGPLHAYGYDAANILLKSIESAAVKDKDNTVHIGRQALRNALQATSGYQGLTGVLKCDKFGDCGSPKIIVVRLDDPAAGFEGLRNNILYTYTPKKEI